ncbi:MAG TPA: hypothetical protein VE987_09320 [Polyangiaceae bacterium]|nr:hypothetical protein [Polyangiaceae bacterium]
MPRGASPKREREYEMLKDRFQKSGRYGGRAAEVASRIVNKQRAQYGETRAEKAQEREGRTPDRALPIANYRHLTVPQIKAKLGGLSKRDRDKIRKYEEQHKHRKTLLDAIQRAA